MVKWNDAGLLISGDELLTEHGRIICEMHDELVKVRKQRNELAWAIAWFLKGGSRDKLEQRFKDYEATL